MLLLVGLACAGAGPLRCAFSSVVLTGLGGGLFGWCVSLDYPGQLVPVTLCLVTRRVTASVRLIGIRLVMVVDSRRFIVALTVRNLGTVMNRLLAQGALRIEGWLGAVVPTDRSASPVKGVVVRHLVPLHSEVWALGGVVS